MEDKTIFSLETGEDAGAFSGKKGAERDISRGLKVEDAWQTQSFWDQSAQIRLAMTLTISTTFVEGKCYLQNMIVPPNF